MSEKNRDDEIQQLNELLVIEQDDKCRFRNENDELRHAVVDLQNKLAAQAAMMKRYDEQLVKQMHLFLSVMDARQRDALKQSLIKEFGLRESENGGEERRQPEA